MKYFIVLFLLLSGCAHPETRSQFLTVDYMSCIPIKKLYYKSQISQINHRYFNDEECGIDYMNVRIKKELIVVFGERASIVLGKIDKESNDVYAPLEITQINKMHCVVQFQSGKMKDISMTCEELEKELK